ncbi:hypothetical protein [Maribacter dokdonensis]|uniref:hypothetical protein n=1 Tax=Maribacter dokdonensis TaxID=320912 RepID=UPI00158709E1|nr:hypothetical protein [Maribacter dokdonensis]
MKNIFLIIGFISLSTSIFAQTEVSKIENTLLNYINGTSYNRSALIEKAFYTNANLY